MLIGFAKRRSNRRIIVSRGKRGSAILCSALPLASGYNARLERQTAYNGTSLFLVEMRSRTEIRRQRLSRLLDANLHLSAPFDKDLLRFFRSQTKEVCGAPHGAKSSKVARPIPLNSVYLIDSAQTLKLIGL